MEFRELFLVGVQLYTEIVKWSIPIAFAFGMGNVIINTGLSVAFGGRLKVTGTKKDVIARIETI